MSYDEKWRYSVNVIDSHPTIGPDNTIFIRSNDQNLYALNPDGTLKWKFYNGSSYGGSPAIGAGGTIYVGGSDKKLYAINSDGTQKWEFETDDDFWGDPAIDLDGTIYVGAGKTYAINPDGTQKWAFETKWIQTSAMYPAIGADGTIYVKSVEVGEDTQWFFYAINPDGTQKWVLETDYEIRSVPAIGSDGTIYVGGGDSKLHAINSKGEESGSFYIGPDGGNVDMTPSIALDGTIYVGANSPYTPLYAIDSNCDEIWQFEMRCTNSSPAISGDGTTIYVGSDENKLHAINTVDGRKKWECATDAPIKSSPVIDSNGTIYFAAYSGDDNFYAIEDLGPSEDLSPAAPTGLKIV